jgi:hypothetical protein
MDFSFVQKPLMWDFHRVSDVSVLGSFAKLASSKKKKFYFFRFSVEISRSFISPRISAEMDFVS